MGRAHKPGRGNLEQRRDATRQPGFGGAVGWGQRGRGGHGIRHNAAWRRVHVVVGLVVVQIHAGLVLQLRPAVTGKHPINAALGCGGMRLGRQAAGGGSRQLTNPTHSEATTAASPTASPDGANISCGFRGRRARADVGRSGDGWAEAPHKPVTSGCSSSREIAESMSIRNDIVRRGAASCLLRQRSVAEIHPGYARADEHF